MNTLKNALTKLIIAMFSLPNKQIAIITEWLNQWSNLLMREKGFRPEFMPRYNRGDILFVDFGWNIGSEFGGVHYAAVLESNNNKTSGTILVIPLTSLDSGKQPNPHEVYLGTGIIPWADSLETTAKPNQIRAISKMRILKPVKKKDKRAKLSPVHLDAIDVKIKELLFAK